MSTRQTTETTWSPCTGTVRNGRYVTCTVHPRPEDTFLTSPDERAWFTAHVSPVIPAPTWLDYGDGLVILADDAATGNPSPRDVPGTVASTVFFG